MPLFEELKSLVLQHLSKIWNTRSIFYGLMAVSVFFFICFYFVGRIYMAFIKLPKDDKTSNVDKVAKILEQQYGQKMANGSMRIYKYIFKESNPLGPILYIVLTKFGVGAALYVGVGKYCPGPYIAEYH